MINIKKHLTKDYFFRQRDAPQEESKYVLLVLEIVCEIQILMHIFEALMLLNLRYNYSNIFYAN
jgi:hypothetical protein